MELTRKNGDLTAYAMACGYVYSKQTQQAVIYMHQPFSGCDYIISEVTDKGQKWHNYAKYNEALKHYKKLAREIGN